MKSFPATILNNYRPTDKIGLAELSRLVTSLSSKMGLSRLKEVNNLGYNYLFSGFQGDDPIILKLSIDTQSLQREAQALKCFDKLGAVKLLAHDKGMLLLERLVPGTPLKSYFPHRELEAVEIIHTIITKLQRAHIPQNHNFPHIQDWLRGIDENWNIPSDYLTKARALRKQLLQNPGSDLLLHGDLHHDNILLNGDTWCVIDPKGVIGELSYELTTYIRNPNLELSNHENLKKIILKRIMYLAEYFGLPPKRIHRWCFVHSVLSWTWALEDGSDTVPFGKMTRIFDETLASF